MAALSLFVDLPALADHLRPRNLLLRAVVASCRDDTVEQETWRLQQKYIRQHGMNARAICTKRKQRGQCASYVAAYAQCQARPTPPPTAALVTCLSARRMPLSTPIHWQFPLLVDHEYQPASRHESNCDSLALSLSVLPLPLCRFAHDQLELNIHSSPAS